MNNPLRWLLVTLLLVLAPCIYAQLPAERSGELQELEAQLAGATGSARIDLMVELSVLTLRPQPHRSLEIASEALAQLKENDDVSRRKRVLIALGNAQHFTGDFEAAFVTFEEVERLALETDDSLSYAAALRGIGLFRIRRAEYPAAMEALTEALRIYEEHGNPREIARTLRFRGGGYLLSSSFERALVDYLRGHAIWVAEGDEYQIAVSLQNIAIIYSRSTRFDEALEMYAESLAVLERLGNQSVIGRVLYNMALVHNLRDDYAEAIQLLERSLSIRESTGDQRGLALTLRALGESQLALGELKQARSFFLRALPIAEESNFLAGQGSIWNSLGQILELEQDYGEAQRAFERCLELATDSSDKGVIFGAYESLCRIYTVQGRHREAMVASEAAMAVERELHQAQMESSLTEMRTRFDVQRREQEIQLLEQQQATSEMAIKRQRETGALLVIGLGLVISVMLLALNHYRLRLRAAEMAKEVKVLRGLLPICAHCKQIRDETDQWNSLEAYIDDHSEARFSHGICPDCITIHYPDMRKEAEGKN